jgi:predicted RNA-binding protein YlxR (DUF448 family)
MRTCVGCREIAPKREMIRIVNSPDGVRIDLTGKLPGRGAYLHRRLSCWQKALRGPLGKALRKELTEEERARLSQYAETLSENFPEDVTEKEKDTG